MFFITIDKNTKLAIAVIIVKNEYRGFVNPFEYFKNITHKISNTEAINKIVILFTVKPFLMNYSSINYYY